MLRWIVVAGILAWTVAKIHVFGIFWTGVITVGQLILSGVLDEYGSYRAMKKLPYTIERDDYGRVIHVPKNPEKVTNR